ncbi:MAG: mannose-6-phosphate isomerase, class I [Sediminibacterium sp.]|nr:mannose-6-phosphate isomerase, class I [Sediminibacterium sp.]
MVKKRPYLLKGDILHYDWGGNAFIPQLLNFHPQPLETYAEYWLGAHDAHPSLVHLEQEKGILLNDLIKNYTVFQNEDYPVLPYLLKILDVKKMLSIQVHPNELQAKKGFQQENQAGIPIQSPVRTFKDPFPKPEMMVALSDFWLLHGFNKTEKIIHELQQFQELNLVNNYLKENGLKKTFNWIMTTDQTQIDGILSGLITNIKNTSLVSKTKPAYWINRYLELTPDLITFDRGLINIFFMNIVNLPYKHAIFQDAGLIHAYLEGQNIELMTASDNVIRGGLTSKHIDIEKLLEMTNFKEITPTILKPLAISENVFDYNIPFHVAFRLHWIENHSIHKNIRCVSQGREILCCIAAKHPISIQFNENEIIKLVKGQAVIIPQYVPYNLIIEPDTILVKAFEY